MVAFSFGMLGGEIMTGNDLIEVVACGTAYPLREVNVILRKTFNAIARELANGEKVQLIGFGTFEVKDRAEREGTNPRTGATIVIPAHKAVIFRPGKTLKEAVNI